MACLPGKPIYNTSFVNRMTASTETITDLGRGNSIKDCISKACARQRQGDLVYLLGTVCHLITCRNEKSCKLHPQHLPDPLRDFVVAPIRWVGEHCFQHRYRYHYRYHYPYRCRYYYYSSLNTPPPLVIFGLKYLPLNQLIKRFCTNIPRQ